MYFLSPLPPFLFVLLLPLSKPLFVFSHPFRVPPSLACFYGGDVMTLIKRITTTQKKKNVCLYFCLPPKNVLRKLGARLPASTDSDINRGAGQPELLTSGQDFQFISSMRQPK
jgi:hypothetical protein